MRIIISQISDRVPQPSTGPIYAGGMMAFRTHAEEPLTVTDDDGNAQPFEDHESFGTLADAMAAHPQFDWYNLPVFAGEPVEEFYATRPVPALEVK